VDEDALLRLAAEDDSQAFGLLVKAHQRRVARFAERMLGDRESAEDAAQEAFLRLWRGRARDRAQGGSLSCLLLHIVRNVCLDYARAARPTEPLDAEPTGGDCLESHVQAQAFAAAARQIVLELPEEQRVVFVLSHYEGLSYREIADVIGCPVGTVASRKHLAVETLRRRLSPWVEEIK
jgi:RNA polymerase sigma-70 factor (ECF subfamily)